VVSRASLPADRAAIATDDGRVSRLGPVVVLPGVVVPLLAAGEAVGVPALAAEGAEAERALGARPDSMVTTVLNGTWGTSSV
jgi:hypothetical protein